MVRVVDAIMGSGKTQAAITYMNEHADQKFIYITPYLKEAERIARCCPALNFVEPSNQVPEFKFSKHKHSEHLILNGRNLATTHQSFIHYTSEMLRKIRELGYTLIIDEDVETISVIEKQSLDVINLLSETGHIVCGDNMVYSKGTRRDAGMLFTPIIDTLQNRELIGVRTGKNVNLYFWALPDDFITAFKDVIVLTYIFEGQHLCNMFKRFNIEYVSSYVSYDGTTYRFTDDVSEKYVPEYVHRLKDMIHICQQHSLNHVGNERASLSSTWYDRHPDSVEKLRKNMWCYFNYHLKAGSKDIMWSAYEKVIPKLRRKGYMNRDVEFNARSTNEYSDKTALAYLVNLYVHTNHVFFYRQYGMKTNDDAYALSTMVQWIWRSAIRNGKEVHLYLPSKRMREILEKWIDETQRTAKERNN